MFKSDSEESPFLIDAVMEQKKNETPLACTSIENLIAKIVVLVRQNKTKLTKTLQSALKHCTAGQNYEVLVILKLPQTCKRKWMMYYPRKDTITKKPNPNLVKYQS